VLTIPSGEAARQAWLALPDSIRAEVKQYAANDQGHPDPAVAAVAVGQARAERVWPWWRTTLLGIGTCLFVGEFIALLALGGSISDLTGKGWAIVVLPGLAGFALFAGTPELRTPGWLPQPAEVANLRTFLAAPDAHASEPTRRTWLTPRRAAVGAGMTLGVAGVAAGATVAMGGPVGGADTLVDALIEGVTIVAFFGGLARFLRIRRGTRRARRVTVAADGLRFGHRPPIPWTDVTGATITGPTAARPEDEGLIVWIVRGDQPTVETPLHGSGPPEELILSARSYMAAARQAV
jgi:hypothetical protein